MAHCKKILNQLTAFFPRYDFEKLVSEHYRRQKFRSYNRWSQFLAMMIAQLTGRKSLRDLVGNIGAQGKRSYHLGIKTLSLNLPFYFNISRTKEFSLASKEYITNAFPDNLSGKTGR